MHSFFELCSEVYNVKVANLAVLKGRHLPVDCGQPFIIHNTAANIDYLFA
jgi:hypothetical protein